MRKMIGAIFVDGASISMALKEVGEVPVVPIRINYARLPAAIARALGEEVEFRYRCYYTAYRDERGKVRRAGFKKILVAAGWEVFEMKAKEYFDGHFEDKGVDLALALDAFWLARSSLVRFLVVATHDADFAELFRRLPAHVSKVALGWKAHMASELKECARPVYLDDLKGEISYTP